MGQINNPVTPGIILSPTDRLIATNADGGLNPNATHVILFGEASGQNMGAVASAISIGWNSGRSVPAAGTGLIVMGINSGGSMASADAIVIGSGSLNAGVSNAASIIALGNNIAPLLTNIGTVDNTVPILIGSNLFPLATVQSMTDLVAIGRNVMPALNTASAISGPRSSVLIGSDLFVARGNAGQFGDEIAIGHDIFNASTFGVSNKSIMVGNRMFTTGTTNAFGTANGIVIGHDVRVNSAGDFSKLTNAISIGHDITYTSAANPTSGANNSIIIGTANSVFSQRDSIIIGYSNLSPGTTAVLCQRNTIIGELNNFSTGTWSDGTVLGNANTQVGIGPVLQFGNMFVVSQNDNIVIAGSHATGNIQLGKGTTFPLNAVAPTNGVGVFIGTRGAGNPVGGGFFYAATANAVLHWVGVDGRDSILSPAAGQLAACATVAYTNNAGAVAGTLTNSPTAGNPTKWIPIDDNGTIRNIPAW